MRILKVLAATLAIAMAVPAAATVQITSQSYVPEGMFGGLNVTSLGLHDGGSVGRFALSGFDTGTDQPVNFQSYCLDIQTGLFTFINFDVSPISAALSDVTKQAQLAGLLVNANPLIALEADADTKRAIAASIGLAVWEIVYEPLATGYTITDGNFSVYGDFNPLAARADGYLVNVLEGTWQASPSRVSALIAARDGKGIPLSQDQVFINNAVPEPATWLTMILGFGFVGAAVRRARGSYGSAMLKTPGGVSIAD